MLPKVPTTLSPAELRDLYHDPDAGSAGKYGIVLEDASEWERYRKYAFVRYWEQRIAKADPLSQVEVDELKAAWDWTLMRKVAIGLIGDAARRGVLSPQHVEHLITLIPPEEYAGRQLRARSILSGIDVLDESAIESLLVLRAAWALEELVNTTSLESELQRLEQSLDDPRLYRIHRHSLREAIRLRRRHTSRRS